MLPPPITTATLDAESADFRDLLRELVGHRGVDPGGLGADQRFAGQLEKDAPIGGRRHGAGIIAQRFRGSGGLDGVGAHQDWQGAPRSRPATMGGASAP